MPERELRRAVVAVAGGTCSGKSTFAALLLARLGDRARVVSLDAFYTGDSDRGPTVELDGKRYFDYNHPGAVDVKGALAAVAAGSEPVVVLEGLFALAIPALRAQATHRRFIHLDADLRALRRLRRDMAGGRLSRDPAFIAAYYAASARVGHVRYVEPSRGFAEVEILGEPDELVAAADALAAELAQPRPGPSCADGPLRR